MMTGPREAMSLIPFTLNFPIEVTLRKLWKQNFPKEHLGMRGKQNLLFTLSPVIKQLFINFSRSRFLHVWSLENKRLLHVIQLPARVRLVRQLEFISNSFDGGSSQVSKQ